MNINPTLTEFKKIAKQHNLIVLSRKFYADWLTPLSIYQALRQKVKAESFLLESVEGAERICRFSFIGCQPIVSFKSKGSEITINDQGKLAKFVTTTNPLDELAKLMSQFKVGPMENLRFFGGFVGYAGYELIRFFEPIGQAKPDPLKLPDNYFILPKYLIVFDHVKRQVEILDFVVNDSNKNIQALYDQESDNLENIFKTVTKPVQLPHLLFKPRSVKVKSNFSKAKFCQAVKKIKQHIVDGDIIQAVLSQRFSLDYKADPFTAYRYLRVVNPSPYMFFLNFKDLVLAGASPEMLLRCENNQLVTHPIAGTRKRGVDQKQDKLLEKELLADKKERAEHLMLVDLARNDLGKVAEKGKVLVSRFMQVERFSHVMHIVSEVNAQLDKSQNLFSAFASCFPAGTVSGAPKVRAMQIVNDLEPQARGVYAGSVGYFSFTNSLDTGIIIRTVIFKDNKAYVQAGAGIVYDSVPQTEFLETKNKAKAQILALRMAAGN